jgi:methyl-accepting chemotaxis protein
MFYRIHDLRIKNKLWLNAAVGLTAIFLLWLFIIYIARTTDKSFRSVEATLTISDAAGDTAVAIRFLAEPAREVLGDWNVVEAQRRLEAALEQYRERFERLKTLLVNEKDPRVREGLLQIEEGVARIVDLSKTVFRLADEKIAEESREKMIGAQAAIEKAIEVSAEMNRTSRTASETMEAVVTILRQETTQIFKENVATNRGLSIFSSLLFFCSAGLSLLVSYIIGKSVSNPMTRLQKAVEEIGAGNLDHRVKLWGQDEIGAFAKSFGDMVGDLRQFDSGIQDG